MASGTGTLAFWTYKNKRIKWTLVNVRYNQTNKEEFQSFTFEIRLGTAGTAPTKKFEKKN
jgi:hypothetical protein